MDTLTIIKVACFLLGTGCLVYVSRASLAAPRSHGFYRFLAWVAILGLILLNIDFWFREPFSWHQLISWPLLIISAFLVVIGVRLLKQRGKPDAERRLQQIEQERQQLYKAQQQIQGNMGALGTTGKEGTLRARYVEELEATQDRLRALAGEEAEVKEEI